MGNAEKSGCAASVRAAAQLIRRSGRSVVCDEITARLARLKVPSISPMADLARAVDLLLVFGGDGTMLHAARQIAGSDTPMLGVNIGGLGFLTAVPSSQLAEALRSVWRGEFKFESRALIEASGAPASGATVDAAITVDSSSKLTGVDLVAQGAALIDIQSTVQSSTATLKNGGTIDFHTTFTGAVAFAGTGDLLSLTQPELSASQPDLLGPITGFVAGDKIDLTSLDFLSAADSGVRACEGIGF